ncbi:CTD small phosphatase-like protein 2-A isoform X2 [Macadamia integrifolia]|uniref:CTD small phosphatase-like protein 2-A isoform X2 n=1 Tax=Macadamia integrifolia TaxID=60698 RepID=UPI001C527E55|nr:CTD small phosphatase-like protein 2-A isoform X2 [Macadamia integrifolia]
MPALKMKAKSNPEGLRGQSLQVSNKSCKISKSSSQQVRISQQTAELDTDLQNSQDVYSNFEASLQGMGCDEVVDDPKLVNGATLQLQESSLSSVDSAAVSRMDFPSASCNQDLETIFSPVLESSSFPSNLETIFSPILETNEVHYIPEIYNYAVGSDEEPDVPHLISDESDDGSSSSCGYQTCNISDFFMSDMSPAGLSFYGNVGFDDVAEANSFLGYNCTDSDMTSDMTERYMILPFLEETARPSNVPDEELCEEVVMNSDDSCLYLAIHKMKSSGQEPDVNSNSVDSDEGDCFEPHLFIKNFPDLSDVVPSFRPMLLPKETRKRKSITLVLDLDETLVHSTLEQCDDADFTFQVFFNMEEHTVYVRQRPYLQTFLERVAEMFEVFVFTASQSNYAEQLLNILDPEGKLISRRAYRESCIFSDGSYTKDLTVLGVDLAKVAIIDNSPQVFRLQVNNGIPIKSWFDDPSDRALISLLPFLETLVDADDVRPIIAKRFGDSDLAKIITLAFTLHR